jgi:hypothetical protein
VTLPERSRTARAPRNATRSAVATPVSALGLCSTCRHAGRCCLREPGAAVACCEEFELLTSTPDGLGPAGFIAGGLEPSQGSRSTITSASPANAATTETETELANSELKGLCINCLHRTTCRFTGAEGGIWHCEEYA